MMKIRQLFGGVEKGVTAWDFEFTSLDGKPMPLAQYHGKPVLVVNTASECGFTPQYKALQALYDRYHERGLVVLGVPCNDFGGQEPATESEIGQFCERNFGVSFPLTAKTKVKGKDAHPFYLWAAQVFGAFSRPRWNFHKYLVAPDGSLADWFSTPTKPDSARLIRAVERVLPGSI
jgi:glutathione peroxidase